MKKILLGTSAIAGLAFATAAQAQDPIQIGISGALDTSLAFNAAGGDGVGGQGANNLAGADNLAIQQDWSLNFTGSTTLENGLTIGVYIELDQGSADSNNGEGTTDVKEDEVYAVISGGFGEFRIGQDDAALNDVNENFVVTGGSLFYDNDGAHDIGINTSLGGPLDTDLEIVSNDATIWYRTPRFAGFRALASYTPDTTPPGDQQVQADSTIEDVFSFAVDYENSFSGVDLGVYGGFSIGNNDGGGTTNTDDPLAYAVGATVGVAGFTVGGGYNAAEFTNGGDQWTANAGVSYSIDKVSVGVLGMFGETEAGTGSAEDTGWSVQVDGSYALGPGVTVGAAVGYSQLDLEGAGGSNVGDFSGVGFGTSLEIDF